MPRKEQFATRSLRANQREENTIILYGKSSIVFNFFNFLNFFNFPSLIPQILTDQYHDVALGGMGIAQEMDVVADALW